jgi:hypothetical protein
LEEANLSKNNLVAATTQAIGGANTATKLPGRARSQ